MVRSSVAPGLAFLGGRDPPTRPEASILPSSYTTLPSRLAERSGSASGSRRTTPAPCLWVADVRVAGGMTGRSVNWSRQPPDEKGKTRSQEAAARNAAASVLKRCTFWGKYHRFWCPRGEPTDKPMVSLG
jgi:hypothetical protein